MITLIAIIVLLVLLGWMSLFIVPNKTRDKIREDAVLKNCPLYCPKCKRF